MTRRIVVGELPLSDALTARIREAAPGWEVVGAPVLTADAIRDAEVVVGSIPPDLLAGARSLRWNHLWTAGADADLSDAMVRADVVLTTSAGNGAVPLAEHAMLLMLMVDRDARRWMRAQDAHRWDRFRHGELAGRTVGIIGMGGIGRDLATKCAAFHMRVLGVRSRPGLAVPHVERMRGPAELADVAAECDFLVVTAPLTPETTGLVDARVLGALRPGSIVVNVSRGEIVDHDALLEAVTSGRIAGAGLDAHRDEPLPADSPWWDLDAVVVTPHNGATTTGTMERGIDILLDDLTRHIAGRPLMNVVDKRRGYALD